MNDNEILGWSIAPHMLSGGISIMDAIAETRSVVDAVIAFHQPSTGAHFVLGPSLFATIEPRGRLYRCRYARYPVSMRALVEKLQGEGVEQTFAAAA